MVHVFVGIEQPLHLARIEAEGADVREDRRGCLFGGAIDQDRAGIAHHLSLIHI